MVIKNNPRAILDMLNKPVDVDEDEFLNKLDVDKCVHNAPDHPAEELSGAVMNTEQTKMLGSLADTDLGPKDEEDLPHAPLNQANEPIDLTQKERRFFSLFQGVTGKTRPQGSSPPRSIDLSTVHPDTHAASTHELPRVWDTQEEKEAKEEDEARRAAYIELEATKAAAGGVATDAEQAKKHDRFVAIFGGVRDKRH